VPTYQYRCTECGHAFEQVQSFSDDALTDCPVCQGRLRKVFHSVGIVFKGSGFYRTDSREKASSEKADKQQSEKSDKPEKGDKTDKPKEKAGVGGQQGGSTSSSEGTSSGSTKSAPAGGSSSSSGSSSTSGSSSKGSAA
jgi:putative FmdB family regulatory protein